MENSFNNGNLFFYPKDSEETCTMHTNSYNIEIIMDSETDETNRELFESFLQK